MKQWSTNAELIVDVATLGHIGGDVVDVTHGDGHFWTLWRPSSLTATDLDPHKSPMGLSVDFRDTPWPDQHFDTVVYDPPYRLNGTPDRPSDAKYGTGTYTRWQERLQLILEGVVECARITKVGGHLLTKCQDMVVSGQMVWQTDMITETLQLHTGGRWRKKDRLDMVYKPRPQPPGRSQKHARHNSSTLLVFVREK